MDGRRRRRRLFDHMSVLRTVNCVRATRRNILISTQLTNMRRRISPTAIAARSLLMLLSAAAAEAAAVAIGVS